MQVQDLFANIDTDYNPDTKERRDKLVVAFFEKLFGPAFNDSGEVQDPLEYFKRVHDATWKQIEHIQHGKKLIETLCAIVLKDGRRRQLQQLTHVDLDSLARTKLPEELTSLEMSVLKRRALAAGVKSAALDDVDDHDNPRRAIIELLLKALCPVDQVEAILRHEREAYDRDEDARP
eukprot:SAG31_NODE_1888_length_6987_cov_1.481852_3_plen_177_part_00